jgi:hypothetical protein
MACIPLRGFNKLNGRKYVELDFDVVSGFIVSYC